jgi:hypothetical protein
MKQKLFQIAFVISVSFNMAAIGAVTYSLSSAKSASENKANTFAVYKQLNLTDEQKRVLYERYFDLIRRITESQQSYATKWGEIVDLIAQPQTDWKAIDAKQKEILDDNRATQTTIFQRWDWAKSQLTPEQQRIFFEILRERIKSGELLGEIKSAQEILRKRATPSPH